MFVVVLLSRCAAHPLVFGCRWRSQGTPAEAGRVHPLVLWCRGSAAPGEHRQAGAQLLLPHGSTGWRQVGLLHQLLYRFLHSCLLFQGEFCLVVLFSPYQQRHLGAAFPAPFIHLGFAVGLKFCFPSARVHLSWLQLLKCANNCAAASFLVGKWSLKQLGGFS